ncbi:MAG: hypothetical protein K2Y13_11705 [Burkholderiaceae bacterium]|uniref:CDP-diacylglycerol--glycerol-3-phosphate 3-phosphatidyltransferase n=1 Tax=Herminiimonas contaminans TaxID=1111140 RepID=A0ABS0ESC2_9BURK|nr:MULTISPECIES: hypothetical protein [Oxalobacteraceae]MBF8177742.1 hypothetical protein [Herminiimonas contaminans]MBX9800113.1 hypothetical protein [Burkholderiaceae bacterium]
MTEFTDILTRIWTDLMSRPSGPMAFRFMLQPTMGIIIALLDGIKDARTGRSPYFWTLVHRPEARVGRIKEGLKATSRIILLSLGMEAIYQYKVLHTFYVAEALIITFCLAVLPYLLLRGPFARIARYWIAKKNNQQ